MKICAKQGKFGVLHTLQLVDIMSTMRMENMYVYTNTCCARKRVYIDTYTTFLV